MQRPEADVSASRGASPYKLQHKGECTSASAATSSGSGLSPLGQPGGMRTRAAAITIAHAGDSGSGSPLACVGSSGTQGWRAAGPQGWQALVPGAFGGNQEAGMQQQVSASVGLGSDTAGPAAALPTAWQHPGEACRSALRSHACNLQHHAWA